MNLIIDQGNTSVKVALFEDDEILEVRTFENSSVEALKSYIENLSYRGAIYSSVSLQNDELIALLSKNESEFIILNHQTKLPITIEYATPHTLGVDRIAGAVGARKVNSQSSTLVIDAGTAITYDYITSEGVYKGGNIAPGISIRFKSLNNYTKSLPLVEVSDNYPELGNDTVSAILSGVMSGVVYECEGYIAKISKKEPDIKVIITGGDHKMLYNQLKNSTFVSLIDEEYLVLKGLNSILRYNAEK